MKEGKIRRRANMVGAIVSGVTDLKVTFRRRIHAKN